MFILKRQDVELSKIQHPSAEQPIPILTYQGQTYRLLKVFEAHQAEEAKALWRDLIDNKGKVSVLLQEPERHSVWGKIRLDQGEEGSSSDQALPFLFTQGVFLMAQAVVIDIEDLLGPKQAKAFEKSLTQVFQQWNLPHAGSEETIVQLISVDPLEDGFPTNAWKEVDLSNFLREVHRLGKDYFGNTSFAVGAMEVLDDLSDSDRQSFVDWLRQSGLAKLWKE
ncbi:hypothetical protein PN466_12495 [Roseofilum reptotaenium CS-1145]|uniref:Uncharacterized protein n=1 Tax=Roseofilum reptotaenium AO1-A TaxID=1925591 RepID=A0A1L9QUG0_9CYAN|nr:MULTISPECIES: Npun_F0813 family protein [Roseofilum]MBP0027976.1 hypothetical protein [Roseofilum sp. Guam]MDB9517767.1 hypothetical protein [Roseofilum reptotaenium CS-1145]OJJ26289.1 hypothetical protein BI308_06645 [Roseofilum reptotaenium AO1-A]